MKLDGVTLFATPQFTHVSRGSSALHPMAIDFGWNGAGTQNQPLYCGVYGALDTYVALKVNDPVTVGHAIVIGFETPSHTVYRQSCHMKVASPLAIGTKLSEYSVVGTMGTTGDSTGEHDHYMLFICPKGTPVAQRYNHRVTPDPYLNYVNGFHTADNKLPWVDLSGGEVVPTPTDELVIVVRNTEIERDIKMGDKYEVVEKTGNEITLRKVEDSKDKIGKLAIVKGGKNKKLPIYEMNGNKLYDLDLSGSDTWQFIVEDIGGNGDIVTYSQRYKRNVRFSKEYVVSYK